MKTNSTPWSRFLNLLSIERRDLFQISYYAVFSGIVALSLPLGIQAIINLIQGAQITTSWIVLVVLVTVGVVFSGVLQLMQLRIIETIQQRIFVKSSFELSYRFPKIKMEKLQNFYPPELANRFFDTLIIQKGLSKILIDVPAALLQIIFALLLLSFYHPTFIVFGIILLLLVYLSFKWSTQRGLNTSLVESKFKYKVAHWIQEVARSLVSFKLSGNTNLAMKKNDVLVSQYLSARENHFKIIKFQFIKMIGFKALITAGLLIIGGVLVLSQRMNIGQFVAAEIIILLVINSIEKLILSLESFYDTLTSIEKLGQILDKEMESNEGELVDFEKGVSLELNQVNYQISNRENFILKNISFSVNPGENILIQGKSGSGKSTLLRIITGVIQPTSGNIIVNGISLSALQINHYRAHLGLSLLDEYPFEGTLRENLTFGDDRILEHKISEVINAVGLSDFLKKLPEGLNTELFPEGKQISSSIAKKITMARALLKQPKLVILEDTLDPFNETETHSIIDYLCLPEHSWSLIVVSANSYWKSYATHIFELNAGELIIAKNSSC